MQHARGFIVGGANRWLWSPGRQSPPNSKLGELYMQHVTYGLQGDWLHVCKAVLLVQTRGLLFKFKAILLVQTARAFFKLRHPRASQLSRGLFTGCALIGRLQVTRWGRGIPPFHGKPKPKSWPPAGPGPLPAPAPAAPHNKTFFLTFKNQQEKYQTHEL